MTNFRNLVLLIAILCFQTMFVNVVKAYDNEVWEEGNTYYWKINGVQAGSSANLSTAISSCIGNDREVHILTSGTLTSTLTIRSANVKLYCHGNTLTCDFTGSGIINNGNDGLEIHDLTLRNVVGGYGIRSSAASNLRFTNLTLIDIGWLGMRIDSRTSNPWNYTIYDVYMKDCHFENTGGHGLEFYSIDGLTLEGTMTARHTGDCGVLLNRCFNATVDTVDAYDCCWGGGYAGLRYANGCENVTTNKLIADRCGRGFFIVQSGPTVNCHLNNAEIYECSGLGIWIENGTNCSVKAGCCESPVSASGAGSYADVSNSCDGFAVDPIDCNGVENGTAYLDACGTCVGGNTGLYPCPVIEDGFYKISAFANDLCLTSDGDVSQETCTDDDINQIWHIEYDGIGSYTINSPSQSANLSAASASEGADFGFGLPESEFVIDENTDGTYGISLFNNENSVLDVPGCANTLGLEMNIWSDLDNDCQKFHITQTESLFDCNNVWGGSAYIDECGTCVGGNTGLEPCITIQLEEACAYDGNIETNNEGFQGSGFVNLDNATGTSMSIKLNANDTNQETITISYSNGGAAPRPLQVLVNGEEAIASLNFPATANWTTWETIDMQIALKSGTNEIQFVSIETDGGPNLDQLIVSSNISLADCDAQINEEIKIELSAGWNLIGCPFTGNTDIESALSSIWSHVVVVKDMESFHLKNQAPFLNTLLQLEWGRGYLIKVEEDCTLIWKN